jgi:hypothetical protein
MRNRKPKALARVRRAIIIAVASALGISQHAVVSPAVAFADTSSPYARAVLADSPLAYWRLAESSGTVAHDSSGHGWDGAISGGVTLGAVGAISGDPDTAVTFDGSTGMITTQLVMPTTNFSVEFWHNPTSLGIPALDRPFGSGDSATGGNGLDYFFTQTDSHLAMRNNGQVLDFSCGPVPTLGKWEHVVITVDPTAGATCYRNGVVAGSNAAATAISAGGLTVHIGSSGDGGAKYEGSLDETAIYAHVLTDARVRAHVSAAGHFSPDVNGWPIKNPADPEGPSYNQMAGYYPESTTGPGGMYWGRGPARVPSPIGLAFYNWLYYPSYQFGVCFGMAASATDLYNSGSRPDLYILGQPSTSSLDNVLLNGQPARSVIERYHARQLGARGAGDAEASWRQSNQIGNAVAFSNVRDTVGNRPLMVGIGPSQQLLATDFDRWMDLYNRVSHAVVAYAPDPANTNRVRVYDPNFPGDTGAVLELEDDGGLKLMSTGSDGELVPSIGGGAIPNIGDEGQPSEWSLVPLSDAAFAASGNTAWGINPQLITLLLRDGIPAIRPPTLTASPLLPFHASSGAVGGRSFAGTLPANTGLSTTITASGQGSATALIWNGHLASAVQTDGSAAGSVHSVSIDPGVSSIRVGQPSSTEHFNLQVADDISATVSRSLEADGLYVPVGSSVALAMDSQGGSFTLSSTAGAAQAVPAILQQAGQTPLPLQLSIPAAGQASVHVFDWSDIGHSLIWEEISVGGALQVKILRDNPAQRQLQVQAEVADLHAVLGSTEPPSLGGSLQERVVRISDYVSDRNPTGASRDLSALAHEIEAHSGKGLSTEQASHALSLIASINGLLQASGPGGGRDSGADLHRGDVARQSRRGP